MPRGRTRFRARGQVSVAFGVIFVGEFSEEEVFATRGEDAIYFTKGAADLTTQENGVSCGAILLLNPSLLASLLVHSYCESQDSEETVQRPRRRLYRVRSTSSPGTWGEVPRTEEGCPGKQVPFEACSTRTEHHMSTSTSCCLLDSGNKDILRDAFVELGVDVESVCL